MWRILTFRKGIYGKCGKCNIYKKDILIDEYSIIGSYNYIGPRTSITAATIGNYCSIGADISIGPGDHDLKGISTRTIVMQRACPDKTKSLIEKHVLIGNDVWIGTKAVILRGVTVGNGAIIGANAVVTRDIPDYAIAVGIPARVIKYRFDAEIVNKIKMSNLFEKDIDQAILLIKSLESQTTCSEIL